MLTLPPSCGVHPKQAFSHRLDRPVCMLPHCSFYFLRHGVTDHNQRRVVMGQMDIPLNDQGRRQAEAAGQLLARVGVDRIAASPLSRALETAQIIGRLCGDIEPELIKDLSERDWGALTGRSHRELFKLPPDATPTGAETPLIFSTRILSAVAALIPHEPQQHPIMPEPAGFCGAIWAWTMAKPLSPTPSPCCSRPRKTGHGGKSGWFRLSRGFRQTAGARPADRRSGYRRASPHCRG